MLFHTDELVVPDRSAIDYIGSPMYRVIEEHVLALVLALIVVAVLVFMRRSASFARLFPGRMMAFRTKPQSVVVLAGLLFISSAIHLGLALGHEIYARTPLYLAGAVLLALAGRAAVRQTPRWRRVVALSLVGSLLAYPMALLTGDGPDQLGTMTKMVEAFALFMVLSMSPSPKRPRLATAGAMTMVVFIGVASWIGAFVGSDHHGGDNPSPGFLLPVLENTTATPEQELAAQHLLAETVEAVRRYADPAVAAADGYDVEGISGNDFHADNPSLKNDGFILEPTKPETLVYAMGADGPVLLGAMFQTDAMGEPGPTVGGPLTPWHAHGNICFTIIGLMGATDPFGQCPLGTLSVPHSNEMMHVWTIAGAPEPFGDLDDAWLNTKLGLDG